MRQYLISLHQLLLWFLYCYRNCTDVLSQRSGTMVRIAVSSCENSDADSWVGGTICEYEIDLLLSKLIGWSSQPSAQYCSNVVVAFCTSEGQNAVAGLEE